MHFNGNHVQQRHQVVIILNTLQQQKYTELTITISEHHAQSTNKHICMIQYFA